jgi:hypothetical protein
MTYSPPSDGRTTLEIAEIAATYQHQVELLDAADDAYHWARYLVFDRLPPGVCVRTPGLSKRQRGALETLMIAEAELANYRSEYVAASA